MICRSYKPPTDYISVFLKPYVRRHARRRRCYHENERTFCSGSPTTFVWSWPPGNMYAGLGDLGKSLTNVFWWPCWPYVRRRVYQRMPVAISALHLIGAGATGLAPGTSLVRDEGDLSCLNKFVVVKNWFKSCFSAAWQRTRRLWLAMHTILRSATNRWMRANPSQSVEERWEMFLKFWWAWLCWQGRTVLCQRANFARVVLMRA